MGHSEGRSLDVWPLPDHFLRERKEGNEKSRRTVSMVIHGSLKKRKHWCMADESSEHGHRWVPQKEQALMYGHLLRERMVRGKTLHWKLKQAACYIHGTTNRREPSRRAKGTPKRPQDQRWHQKIADQPKGTQGPRSKREERGDRKKRKSIASAGLPSQKLAPTARKAVKHCSSRSAKPKGRARRSLVGTQRSGMVRAYGVAVSHPLSMREALVSIPMRCRPSKPKGRFRRSLVGTQRGGTVKAYAVVVSHPISVREALGSSPMHSISSMKACIFEGTTRRRTSGPMTTTMRLRRRTALQHRDTRKHHENSMFTWETQKE